MDVICAGMYRACSTWQYEVSCHLLAKYRGAECLGYVRGEDYRAAPNGGKGWRVLKSHEGHARFTEVLSQGRALVLYSYRDLRDVVDSMMHKRQVDFLTFVKSGMLHQIMANDRYWRAQKNVLVQRYEDLVSGPARGVRELASHLGLRITEVEAEEVARSFSQEANLARTSQLKKSLEVAGIDLADPAQAQWYDPRTLLHWNHLRTGRGSGWADKFGLAERRLIARVGGDWLESMGYESDRDWIARGAREGECFRSRMRGESAFAAGWARCRLGLITAAHPKAAEVVKRLVATRKPDPNSQARAFRFDQKEALPKAPVLRESARIAR